MTRMIRKIAQCDEWVGKKATIDDKIHFEYDKINSYREAFDGTDSCDFFDDQKRRWVDNKPTFCYNLSPYYKVPFDKLGIRGKRVLVIETTCRETPFSEIFVKSHDSMVISWDGVYFTLNRVRKEE